MSSPPPLTSYDAPPDDDEAAWHRWRLLLAVVLPVAAAQVAVSALLDLGLGGGRTVVVDGVPQALDADLLSGLKAVSAVVFWLVGLVAGVRAVARETRPGAALWHGVKSLPAYGIGLLAVGAGAYLALWAAAGTGSGGPGVVLVLAVLLAGGLGASRLLLTVLNRGAERPGAFSFLLGGVGVPLLIAYGWGSLGVPGSGTVLLAVALVTQVRLATRTPVREMTGQPPPRLWPAVALLVAAITAAVAVVLVNPYGAPSVRTNTGGPAGPMAVAWPVGKHPVIVTNGGAWFCNDDLCEGFTDANGGPPTLEGYGTATIGVDGTVVKTAMTGGPHTGGPFVHFARCVREGCREGWLPVRASGREPLDDKVRVEAAGAAAPDGALWFFTAVPVPGGQYNISLIRCAEAGCAKPARHRLGVAARTPDDGHRDGGRASLTVDGSGRPTASLLMGHSVYRYRCEPMTCAAPAQSVTDAAPPGTTWTTVGDRAVYFRGGELFDGDRRTQVPGSGSGATAVDGPYVYVAAPQPRETTAGFQVTVGRAAARHWRQTVWRCRDQLCESAPMDAYDDDNERAQLLAVSPDGRVLVVRSDRIVLLETPFDRLRTNGG